jgi:type IV pilus assembly protein PilQ
VSALGNQFALSKDGTNSFTIPEVRTELFEIFNADPDTVRNEIVSLLGYADDTNKIKVSSVVQNSGARVNEFKSNADGVIESYKKTDQAVQRTPGLIITGTVSQLDKIEKAIDLLDRRIPQVFIEAFIVTVTDDFERALGSRLSLLDNGQTSTTQGSLANQFTTNAQDTADNATGLTNLGIEGLTATSGFNVLSTVGVDRLRLGIEAMERDGLARTVANPKIMVINQEKGYFFQGSVLCWTFEAGGSSTTTDGGNVNQVAADKVTQCTDGTSNHPDYPAPDGKELGLKLEVVPTINFSNQLMLDLNVQQTTATTTSATAPPATTKLSLANRLMTNSGDIIVIGGNHALSESFVKRNVPGLGDNFITSFLAGGKEQDDQFKEMLIFLSARKM